MSLQTRAYQVLEDHTCRTSAALLVRGAIMILIFLSTLAIVLESVGSLEKRLAGLFRFVEILAVIAFTIEYVVRLWSITCDPKYQHPVTGRIRYALTLVALIDLLAICPAYLPIGPELLTLRALRLIRVFRLFKLARYSAAVRSLADALASKREEITVVLFVLGVLLVISATLMYYVENEAQPQKFSSIPAAMWWGVSTMTTVGYGDVYPITPLGKVIGAFMAVLGAGLFAMPAAIWGAAFVERLVGKRQICPHCGKELGQQA